MRRLPFLSRQTDTTATLVTATQQSRLVPVRQATAVPRPNTVPITYQEHGYDELATEQLREHAAAGERAASKMSIAAAGMETARRAGHDLIAVNAPLVVVARDRLMHQVAHLGPFAKRKTGSKWGYTLCLVLLLLGDIAGLGGAAIAYGEIPTLAIMQAISASVATVIAGMVGAEVKYLKQARERQLDNDALAKELEPYRTLLLGPTAGRSYVVLASLVSVLVAVFVAVGIFALRASVEGQISGIVFGGLAVGIALGSWTNSFRHADAVADKLDAARQDYRRELRAHSRLTRSWRLARAERAIEEARLIRERHRLHGDAAAAKVTALKFEALQQSPDVVGHGVGTGEIGRKPRLAAKPEPKGKAS